MGRRAAQTWQEACGRISAVLYESDPEGMGADVGAPLDEYDDIAARLLREAIRRPAGQALATCVEESVPTAWPELVAQLVEVIEAYERASAGGPV